MELFDICTEDGTPTGETVERSIAHQKDIRHRTAHVWITRKKNGKIQILLQKRSRNKDSFPGLYDTSSAGHIPAGSEPLESAIRELREELGIIAEPEQMKHIGRFQNHYAKEFNGNVFRDNEVSFVYVFEGTLRSEDLHLQEEEVEEVRWFDFDEVYQERSKGLREHFCVPLEDLDLLETYYDQLEKDRNPKDQ